MAHLLVFMLACNGMHILCKTSADQRQTHESLLLPLLFLLFCMPRDLSRGRCLFFFYRPCSPPEGRRALRSHAPRVQGTVELIQPATEESRSKRFLGTMKAYRTLQCIAPEREQARFGAFVSRPTFWDFSKAIQCIVCTTQHQFR